MGFLTYRLKYHDFALHVLRHFWSQWSKFWTTGTRLPPVYSIWLLKEIKYEDFMNITRHARSYHTFDRCTQVRIGAVAHATELDIVYYLFGGIDVIASDDAASSESLLDHIFDI